MKKSLLVFALAAVVMLAASARADPVVLTQTFGTGTVTATINLSGGIATLDLSGNGFADQVAIHVANGSTLTNFSTPSAGWSGALGLNSNQCPDGTGNWFCATRPDYVALNGLHFEWTFTGGTLTDLESAQFNVCPTIDGCPGHLFSQSGPRVPEPASLALLGAGLLGLGVIRRRK